jgi:hypothetical protein
LSSQYICGVFFCTKRMGLGIFDSRNEMRRLDVVKICLLIFFKPKCSIWVSSKIRLKSIEFDLL